MPRFMDWSVVAMGGLLVLTGATLLWRGRGRPGNARSTADRWARFPLLMGIAALNAQWPRLLHAPFSVLMAVDAVNAVLALVLAAWVVLSVRGRGLPGRGPGTE